jgi:hypothetical protein
MLQTKALEKHPPSCALPYELSPAGVNNVQDMGVGVPLQNRPSAIRPHLHQASFAELELAGCLRCCAISLDGHRPAWPSIHCPCSRTQCRANACRGLYRPAAAMTQPGCRFQQLLRGGNSALLVLGGNSPPPAWGAGCGPPRLPRQPLRPPRPSSPRDHAPRPSRLPCTAARTACSGTAYAGMVRGHTPYNLGMCLKHRAASAFDLTPQAFTCMPRHGATLAPGLAGGPPGLAGCRSQGLPLPKGVNCRAQDRCPLNG